MRIKILSLLLSCCLLLSMVPATVLADEASPLIVEVPIALPLENATGIQLEILVDDSIVEGAKLTSPSAVMENALYAQRLSGDIYKLSIASATPITYSETLFYLELTLKREAAQDQELCKALRLTVNEALVEAADDRILLGGVANGKSYNTSVTPTFNEGTATLNGEAFLSGTTVSQEGSYTLVITDSTGASRTVTFAIDMTPPVITITPYDTVPTNQSVTVEASVNEGTLNATSYTFTQNGSFTFVATDAAGNTTEETVTISHIYTSFQLELLNIPDGLFYLEGMLPDISLWQLQISYDNGMQEVIPITEEMLTLPEAENKNLATVTYLGQSISFGCRFLSLEASELVITALPVKTTYRLDEAFDPRGLEVLLTNGEDFRQAVTDYTITGFDSSAEGQLELTVHYGQLTATFIVQVTDSDTTEITSQVFTIRDGYLTGAVLGNTVDVLLAGLDDSTNVRVLNGETEAMLDEALATGMVVQLLSDEEVIHSLIVVVTGDINGDGRISITDMISVKSHILGMNILENAQALAADYNGDGRITITDFVQLKAQILGKNMDDSQ